MGAIAVTTGAIVYIDANALIHAVERVEPYASLLPGYWEAARAKRAPLVGSELLVIETLTGPLKRRDSSLVAAYELILGSSDLRLLPITGALLRRSAGIRADHGLKTPDAIHAATAPEVGCAMYLTNDGGFRRVPGISPTILSDLLTPEN